MNDDFLDADAPLLPSGAALAGGFVPLGDLIDEVREVGEPTWLVEPFIAAEGDYGVIAADFKVGKSWALIDLAVSVATGTPWLGIFDVRRQGAVLLFAGEGGARKLTRRFEAVCRGRGVDPAGLDIHVCLRAPNMTNEQAMAELEDRVDAIEDGVELIIVDPLYLATAGANGASLFDMGSHLQRLQRIAQKNYSSLIVAHHHNQGEGRGAKRMSGAGPAAWGRFLMSMSIPRNGRHTDPVTMASSVTIDVDVAGDELPDQTFRLTRRVWAADPADLNSDMHYEVRADTGTADDTTDGLTPSARRVAAILNATGDWATVSEVAEGLVGDGAGPPLKPRTIQVALASLVEANLAKRGSDQGADANAGKWRSAHPEVEGVGNAL